MDQSQGDQEDNRTDKEGAQDQPDTAVNQDSFNYQRESSDEQPNDDMAGMSGVSSEPSSNEFSEQSVASAEEHVAEAVPQAASDELASVASELEAMEAQNFDNETVSVPVITGVDPMQQIQANETTELNETTEQPQATETSEPTYDEPVSEAPVNEEPVPETMPVSAEIPDVNAVSVEPAIENSFETEPIVASDTVTPIDSQQTGPMINDVFAPSSTAVAESLGTAGSNAITGTPETTSTNDAFAAASTTNSPQEKSKKGILILVVMLVTMLFGGAAVAAYLSSSKESDEDKDLPVATQDIQLSTAEEPAKDTVSSTPVPGENVTAVALDDYKVACGGGKVLNAATYAGASVHPIVMFEKGSDDKFAQNILAFKDATWSVNTGDITSGQLVGCISIKTGSENKLKSCPITDPTTKVVANVDFYSAVYVVDIYNAKTGAKIGTFESASVATDCPTTAIYDKAEPKIYANYDLTALETVLKDYVTKAL